MKNILNKSYTLKQIFMFLLMVGVALFFVYVGLMLADGWKKQFIGIGYRNSPYAKIIPSECRRSASLIGYAGTGLSSPLNPSVDLKKRLTHDGLLMKPSGYIYSLSESEKKLGFGMRGIPCMGYDFLMTLHGKDFKRRNLYVNEAGEVVASVTFEVIKPYRNPLPNNLWLNG